MSAVEMIQRPVCYDCDEKEKRVKNILISGIYLERSQGKQKTEEQRQKKLK